MEKAAFWQPFPFLSAGVGWQVAGYLWGILCDF
jgi:hypothetical protein